MEAAVANARATLQAQEKYGSLDSFLWRAVDGKPLVQSLGGPSRSSRQNLGIRILAKECKEHGFRFIGPTVAYSFMQAVGMVNDHEVTCFRHKEVSVPVQSKRGQPGSPLENIGKQGVSQPTLTLALTLPYILLLG